MASNHGYRGPGRRKQGSAAALLLPVVVSLCLIALLTAGGAALSLRQSRQTGAAAEGGKEESNSSGEAARFQTQPETEAEAESAEDAGTAGTAVEPESEEETEDLEALAASDFAAVKETLTELLAQDSDVFSNSSVNFETARQAVLAVDGDHLTGDDLQLYQVLLDHMNSEENAYSLRGDDSMIGQPLSAFGDSGLDRFRTLLSYYTGSDTDPDTARQRMADELNGAYQDIVNLNAGDSSLAGQAAAANRTTASSAYLYATVTASSDPLKLACAPFSLESGWQEYALLRTYATDDSLSDSMKMYMQCYTRVYYALYGLVDISVNYGNWQLSDVQSICTSYFGAVSADYVQNLYNSVVSAPGELAGASLMYLELDFIRQTLENNMADYTEQYFINFLFGNGPASVRVYDGWIGLTAGFSAVPETAAPTEADPAAAADTAAATTADAAATAADTTAATAADATAATAAATAADTTAATAASEATAAPADGVAL